MIQQSFFGSEYSFPVALGDFMFIRERKDSYDNEFYIFEVQVIGIYITLQEIYFTVSRPKDLCISTLLRFHFEDVGNRIFYDIDSLKKHYHIK